MNRKELFRRYTLFLCSVFVNAFSIAVITKALLGTSPISSVPYVLSLFTPGTMGQYTIIMNFGFILLEMVMMKRKEIYEKRFELLSQIPVTLCFGAFIDVSMHLLGWLNPTLYIMKVITLLIGCFILGLGISWEVKANVAMVTGEYLVQIISKFVRKEFGFVKVCFDVTLVSISCLLCLCFLPTIEGVREGTVIAALIVGPISHFLFPYWKIFDKWLLISPEKESLQSAQNRPIVITITREYGSGGRILGEMLAQKLGIKFYDKELIALVAQESRLPEKYIAENEQRVSSNYLLHIILQDYEAPIEKSLSSADALFVSQSRIVRKIASQEPCVIIGRCADYILRDFPSASIIKVFCYTNLEAACERCTKEYHLQSDNIREEVLRTNRARINHYQHYTNEKWGDPHRYDLMLNTGTLSMETACTLIEQLYKEKKGMQNALHSNEK